MSWVLRGTGQRPEKAANEQGGLLSILLVSGVSVETEDLGFHDSQERVCGVEEVFVE